MRWRKFLGGVLAAGLVAAACAAPVQAAPQTLYLFNWADYIDPAIVKDFEQKFDAKVVINSYGTNDQLYTKLLAAGDSQYDVVVPSSYYVPKLVKAGLLQPLDKAQLPNFENLMPRFRNPDYDPDSAYTVAYLWGTTGIAYNRKKLPEAPHSWALLFDPKVNPEQPFSIGPDARVTLGSVCAYLDGAYPCTSKEQYIQAAKFVGQLKQRKNFTGFVDGVPALLDVARGNAAATMTFNGAYMLYSQEDPETYKDVAYFVPKEGAELWVDVMAIPAHAPHAELAHAFINFILDPKIGARLSNRNMYATPNQAAEPYLNPVLAKPPVLPDAATMQVIHLTPALEGRELQFVEQLWTEVRSQ